MQVGIRHLKTHLSAVLERVKAGEEVVVTDRGVPVARLEHIAPAGLPAEAAHLVARGQLLYKPPRRVPLKTLPWLPGEKSSTDFVREQRR